MLPKDKSADISPLSKKNAASQNNLESDAIYAFLEARSASDVRHSGKSLKDHLIGVEDILARWGLTREVQLGGLMHSIYGTERFKRAVQRPSERDAVRTVVGAEAERLAWMFGGLNVESLHAACRSATDDPELRMRWSEAPVPVSPTDLRSLALIHTANWLEQFDRMRPKARVGRMEEMRRLADWLGGTPKADVYAAYGFNVAPLVIDRTSRPPSAEAPVEVWDGAVPLDLQIRLAGLMDLNIWRYGWKASHEQTAYGFWHSHFGGDDNEAGITDCEHDLVGRPLIAPVLELWRMLQAGPLEGHAPVRVYANGHTFGGDGHLHRDHTAPGHFTTIYYAHQEWRPNWAGETVFFNEAGDEIVKAVYPKPGRLAHFPGRIQHAARSPSRECPALRSVVVFKSRLIGEAS